MIHYLGHIVEDKVPEKVRLGTNKLKSWEYGYNSQYDVIIISKDGTLGEIYYVNGIHIGFPEKPEDKKEIINWNKTKDNQFWVREPLPEGLNPKTAKQKEEYQKYILQEINRRAKGVWVYVNGIAVYMTGGSYYLYQWNKLDEGYPVFRIIQNELMLYWEACKADDRCYGICYVKNRRFGWSTICDNELLESGTSHTNKKLGIVSKTAGDAEEMFEILVNSFMRLPFFFKIEWDGTTKPKKKLHFTSPTRKKKQSDDIYENITDLDTYIRYYSTALNSMDGGKKVFRSALDEVGKFPKDVPFDKYWKIVKTSHRQGSRIVGKAMVGSTVNSKKKGGQEFENIYNQSDPLERNDNDQTASGLYSLFIPAYLGFEGRYDKFGFSIVDDPEKPTLTDEGKYVKIGAKTYLENELKALEVDPEGYNEQLRQFPFTIRDAFRDESDDCAFNLQKIIEQIDYNDDNLNENYHNNEPLGNDGIERGDFNWKGGIQDTEVVWTSNPKSGSFWIRKGCHPPIDFRNKREKKFYNGMLAWAPIGEHLGCFGADPYDRDKSADGKGSKGSIHLCTKMNTSDLPNNKFILEYIDRAQKVTIFFEQVLMAMVYYSIPMLAELSNAAFLQYIYDRGYRHYSLNNPFKSFKELSPTESKLGGAPPQNTKIADQQFYAVEAYINDNVGIALDESNRDKGTVGDVPFTRMLKQWKDVELENRTKYDAYISSSLALLGNQRRTVIKADKPKRKVNLFTKYNNKGTISKAV